MAGASLRIGANTSEFKGQIEAEIKKKELIGNGSITPDN